MNNTYYEVIGFTENEAQVKVKVDNIDKALEKAEGLSNLNNMRVWIVQYEGEGRFKKVVSVAKIERS